MYRPTPNVKQRWQVAWISQAARRTFARCKSKVAFADRMLTNF